MEQTINKIKAELVNELEWKKDRDGSYVSGYDAFASIKVGNTVKEMRIHHSTNYDKQIGDDKYKHPVETQISCDKKWEEDLKAVGVEVDWSYIVKEYDKLRLEKIEENTSSLVDSFISQL